MYDTVALRPVPRLQKSWIEKKLCVFRSPSFVRVPSTFPVNKKLSSYRIHTQGTGVISSELLSTAVAVQCTPPPLYLKLPDL